MARRELEVTQGKQAASKFLEATKRKFGKRVEKYEQLRKRTLPDGMRMDLRGTRTLRHRIVHDGYRIGGELTAPWTRGGGYWSFGRKFETGFAQ